MNIVMNDSEILDDVVKVFHQFLNVDPGVPITAETRFFADLGLASIDAVVLGESLQTYYGRPIPFDQLLAELGQRSERDLVIGELVAFLRLHLGRR